MAYTNIRHIVKARLVDLFKERAELAGVQVSYGFEGDAQEKDAVWCAAVNGSNFEIPVMQGGRKQRSDAFNMHWVVQCGSHGDNARTAEAAAAGFLAGVENTLAEDPSLGDLDGLWEGAVISGIEGPDTWRTPEGSVSFYTVTIFCTARYV